jgi:sulfate transport system ATP-binding protein
VYEHPANAFVYSFLGNVNLFHGRVQSGKARIGDIEIDAPEHHATADSPAIGYARPHEMDVARERNGFESIEAVIAYIQAVGPNVKLQLNRTDNGQLLEAELSKDRQRELNLKTGERVYVKPRQVRVFIADPSEPLNYQI